MTVTVTKATTVGEEAVVGEVAGPQALIDVILAVRWISIFVCLCVAPCWGLFGRERTGIFLNPPRGCVSTSTWLGGPVGRRMVSAIFRIISGAVNGQIAMP